jgi:hypothetical protein
MFVDFYININDLTLAEYYYKSLKNLDAKSIVVEDV